MDKNSERTLHQQGATRGAVAAGQLPPAVLRVNIRRSGEQWLFGRKLDQHYGAGHAEKMYRLSRRKYEPTKDEYELHIEYYEAKVASMLARRIERNAAERERVPERMRARMRDVKN